MKNIRFPLFLIFFVFLSILQVSALRVSGDRMIVNVDYEPNLVIENTFMVTSAEDYTSTYDIFPILIKGQDLSQYFIVTPNRIENVESGGSRAFNVRLQLPEKLESPGENEMWVKVKIDVEASGVIRAFPSIAIRYLIFVLYPFKYITWDFYTADMNINETKEFSVQFTNLGEPTIESAYADIEFINLETNQTIKTIKTLTERNIEKRKYVKLLANFDSRGYPQGNYKAIARLYWDGNVSVDEKPFRIGTKFVRIDDYTKLFEYNAINKMLINLSSEWNTHIPDIFARVEIYDIETEKKLKEFKSVSAELMPWEKKSLEAYFDTKGLEKKEYKMQVHLLYGDAGSRSEDIIKIDENINAVTVEEIPGKFKLDLAAIFTPINLLVGLLVIFIVINIILVLGYFRRKKDTPATVPVVEKPVIDPDVIEKVREMKKRFNDTYIREMMTKKGWSKEKIDEILKQIK